MTAKPNYVLALAQLLMEQALPPGIEINAMGGEHDYEALIIRGVEKPSQSMLEAAWERWTQREARAVRRSQQLAERPEEQKQV